MKLILVITHLAATGRQLLSQLVSLSLSRSSATFSSGQILLELYNVSLQTLDLLFQVLECKR